MIPAACGQLPWLQALPSLPPTVAIPTEKVTAALATKPFATMTQTPAALLQPSATPSAEYVDLSTEDVANTQAAEEALADAQTKAAILESAITATSTPCPNNRCPSATPTSWRWISPTPTITPTPTLAGVGFAHPAGCLRTYRRERHHPCGVDRRRWAANGAQDTARRRPALYIHLPGYIDRL